MNSEGIALEKKKRPINWKLEFGWRFWLPFIFVVPIVMSSQPDQRFWTSLAAIAGILLAGANGKEMAREEAKMGVTDRIESASS